MSTSGSPRTAAASGGMVASFPEPAPASPHHPFRPSYSLESPISYNSETVHVQFVIPRLAPNRRLGTIVDRRLRPPSDREFDLA